MEFFQRMISRVNRSTHDSDVAAFFDLISLGEMLTKIVVSTFIGALAEHHRASYTHEYRIVRADGIGEWSQTITEILTGPDSQLLSSRLQEETRDMIQKMPEGTWQYEAIALLNKCLEIALDSPLPTPKKVQGKSWFDTFAYLRNKTKGHGALTSNKASRIFPLLNESIHLLIDNFPAFSKSWVYLFRNLSGKFLVIPISNDIEPFHYLKSEPNHKLPNGVYLYSEKPVLVPHIYSDKDLSDFYFPNGSFNEKKYEAISYITDARIQKDATPFLLPTGDLPPSQTAGPENLELVGNTITNFPLIKGEYISRPSYEKELSSYLQNDRHPTITLFGRGGIGKTWLALHVLTRLANEADFDIILWFSARDIDLLEDGPKQVKPQILTKKDIAKDFDRLVKGLITRKKEESVETFFERTLRTPEHGKILFVFDNFETITNPTSNFLWIDQHIRLPNKVLFTTRHREFKGDYPIEVKGMEKGEALELIKRTAACLGINNRIDDKTQQDIYSESRGHPYIIKLLLGEIKKNPSKRNIERIMAGRDDVLDALFERTYSHLSPQSQRIFLTLCSWKSFVPRIGIEAVCILRHQEFDDPEGKIEELINFSFVESNYEENQSDEFLSVPIAAMIFGKKKLSVYPLKSSIDEDIKILQLFGASQQQDVKLGTVPRLHRFFQSLAQRASGNLDDLKPYLPVVEFLGRKVNQAILMLSNILREIPGDEARQLAIKYLREYLENEVDSEKKLKPWKDLIFLYEKSRKPGACLNAALALASEPSARLEIVSEAANCVNRILSTFHDVLNTTERREIVKKLADIFEGFIDKPSIDSTDLSRIAWLYLKLGDSDKALSLAQKGLDNDPDNKHCNGLYIRLSNIT